MERASWTYVQYVLSSKLSIGLIKYIQCSIYGIWYTSWAKIFTASRLLRSGSIFSLFHAEDRISAFKNLSGSWILLQPPHIAEEAVAVSCLSPPRRWRCMQAEVYQLGNKPIPKMEQL